MQGNGGERQCHRRARFSWKRHPKGRKKFEMRIGKKEQLYQLTDTCANPKSLLAAIRGELHQKGASIASYVARIGSFFKSTGDRRRKRKCMGAQSRAIRTASLRKIVRERCTAYRKSETKVQHTGDQGEDYERRSLCVGVAFELHSRYVATVAVS